MCGKIEVMDKICIQGLAQKLEQYFSIFILKIQTKSQNQMALKACIVYKRNHLSEEVWPHTLNLLRFTAVILRNLNF